MTDGSSELAFTADLPEDNFKLSFQAVENGNRLFLPNLKSCVRRPTTDRFTELSGEPQVIQ
jgi:hypothetical protein